MNFQGYDLIVIGSGLYGLTTAQRMAEQLGLRVLVLERRSHIGGNAWSSVDPDTGIEVHNYGSHLFHCNSTEVWNYLNRFASFTGYRHHVQTVHAGKVYPMPINLGTMCSFFGRRLSPADARSLISGEVSKTLASDPQNLEEKAISLVGLSLYTAFLRGYTAKQWQYDPTLLPPDIITRLPVRYNFDSRYFSDRYEGLPLNGYAALFDEMLISARQAVGSIDVRTSVDFFEVRDLLPVGVPVVYTGPVDRYFDCRLGPLSWRTLDFTHEVLPTGDFQGCSVMNYADEDVPYTRIHEFRHLHPEREYVKDKTVIFREYSRLAKRGDEPYYPVNSNADKRLYDAYAELAAAEPNVLFGGRLGTYRYLDMHQAVGAALKLASGVLVPYFTQGRPLKVNE